MVSPKISLCEDFNESRLSKNSAIEIKDDGCFARWNGKDLINRHGELVTNRYPDVVPHLPQNCVLDLEICVFSSWKPVRVSKFEGGIQKRFLLTNSKHIRLSSIDCACTAYVFDCIVWQGKDISNLPLSERRKYFEQIGTVKDEDDYSRVIVAEQFPFSKFDELKKFVDKNKLEGLVIKDLNAKYIGDRTFALMKWKNFKDGLFEILRSEKTDNDGYVVIVKLVNGEEQTIVINDTKLQSKVSPGKQLKVGYLNITDSGMLRQPYAKDVIELISVASKKKKAFCSECGAEYLNDAKFCAECGTKRVMQVV